MSNPFFDDRHIEIRTCAKPCIYDLNFVGMQPWETKKKRNNLQMVKGNYIWFMRIITICRLAGEQLEDREVDYVGKPKETMATWLPNINPEGKPQT